MRVRRQIRRISTIYSHPSIFLATLREACTLQHFTADCCLLAPGAGTVERLYERYKQWADDRNLRELSDTSVPSRGCAARGRRRRSGFARSGSNTFTGGAHRIAGACRGLLEGLLIARLWLFVLPGPLALTMQTA